MSRAHPPDHATRGRDLRTISLVGVAHGTSHFFHMLLPPLLPVFKESFGLSYAELGLLVTLFFAVSGIGQALAGLLVDRIGARPVQFAALSCFVAAATSGALAQGYGGLLLAVALAGLGNSPFHPIDFTILNQRVSQPHLGHAFAVHGISGNLGWAIAPVVLLGVSGLTGSWRWALAVCGLGALAVLALMLWQRDAVGERRDSRSRAERVGSMARSTPGWISVLRSQRPSSAPCSTAATPAACSSAPHWPWPWACCVRR